ncbi:TPA: tail protein X [Pasteurella multocida]|uniref:tail protein X n=1 Tax=Pasteurella TaxID=745 RepID=UPI0028787A00|nr:tail protein X [Pasteurella multocida]MEB3481061.1 tail protein X [Pasteurella multocida]HDR1048068.1 tail protein X [Pasteurella multocida]HDR1140470.1 tail protein X [Pasteurella multocida]HDX1153316.1 tail protein X [Pasteurella multocida]HED4432183.1 tail protein X [Pasteurella multocida]
MQVYAEQNDTLDAVIFRHMGTSNGLLEEALLLNPHLANQAVLDIGTVVILPSKQQQIIKKDSLKLWD